MQNYLKYPWLFAWLNFDGEHYLSIAQEGYQPLTYFFFPAYPVVTRLMGWLFGGEQISFAVSGLIISNVSFIVALMGLWKLAKEDFSEKIAKYTVVSLLVFPVSFYFGSFYTESLYLMLTVWSFYLIRRNRWFYGGVLGAGASATRIIGIALVPAYLTEYARIKNKKLIKFACILIIFLGLAGYMLYLKLQTGDPLNFLNTVGIFGGQRSSTLILLPQVFYRYFFKILPNLSFSYFPVVFSAFLEITTAIVFLALSVWAFFRLRFSYAVYLVLGYLIPILSGSFSSLPRYVIVLFPAFILIALWVSKLPGYVKLAFFTILFVLSAIALSLFSRGYWIA